VLKKGQIVFGVLIMLLCIPKQVFAMHIMEGFISPKWCITWGLLCIPFLVVGYFSIKDKISEYPKLKIILGVVGAFTFVLSALKIPSVTGSCSHPTGIALGAIIFGPTAMSIIGIIVLIFQALLLAHGGITTLGANTFSMAIVGAFVAFFTFKLVKKLKGPEYFAVFLAAFLGDLMTYVTTSIQLALAYPAPAKGFMTSLVKFLGIFAVTQIPLAISEGILTVLIFNTIKSHNNKELKELKVLSEEV
jgi:cobalt/nickel transport system permease protein